MNKNIFIILAIATIGFLIYNSQQSKPKIDPTKVKAKKQLEEAKKPERKTAIFAGGCFWCTESTFEKVEGVKEVISGYIGGRKEHAFYDAVSSGRTKHIEAIQVIYDPNIVDYKKLLDTFWKLIDPTDPTGSFVDRGYQYTSCIYYLDDEQKKLADKSIQILSDSGWFDEPIVTPIRKATPFYVAEDYHQDYYKKEPTRYQRYRSNSGRDQYYERVWKDKPDIFSNPQKKEAL